ncbi:MAG: hypothetical protein CMO17_03255 [Thaumarchaeota archaeon]|jgi:hypothetical protein|nr:hypothetical protein [Nitrososphaerota archaeon]|tara:strand:+ start:226 stop:606 length:381 start_codon:yes stop_codon:yes gene_type:complete
MKTKDRAQKNLLEVRNLLSTIDEKLSSINDKTSFVEKLDFNELGDFSRILTLCEIVLSKHENKKAVYQNMKRFVDILDSTVGSIEHMDNEIDELGISADFSIKKIKEFESLLMNQSKHTSFSDTGV